MLDSLKNTGFNSSYANKISQKLCEALSSDRIRSENDVLVDLKKYSKNNKETQIEPMKRSRLRQLVRETVSEITDQALVDEFSEELDDWIDSQSESYQAAAEICDVTDESNIIQFLDDWDWEERVVDRVDEYCNQKFEEYYAMPDSWTTDHGFIFDDGSVLSIPGDDHRIIDIDKWYKENIITIHIDKSDSELVIRFNENKTSNDQIRKIKRIIKTLSIDTIIYDVYDKSKLVDSGQVDSNMLDLILN